MRTMLFLLLSLSHSLANEKPFDRVLIFPAGGLRTAMYLGAAHELIESGWKPDAIIATCGASLPAAIINQNPDPKKWKEIVRSKEFYDWMSKVEPNDTDTHQKDLLSHFGKMLGNAFDRPFAGRAPADRVRDVFSDHLVTLPEPVPAEWTDAAFKSDGIKVIFGAVQMNYGPDETDKGRGDRKLFIPSYFTDEETRKKIRDFRSPLGQKFPQSAISNETRVHSQVPIYEASRSAMTEPYLTNPVPRKLGDGSSAYFLSGPDLYQIDLARALGKEVAVAATPFPDLLGDVPFEDLYGVSWKERYEDMIDKGADHWIDFSDAYGPAVKNYEPKLAVKVGDVLSGNGVKLEKGMPSYAEYVKWVDQQWDYGQKRAREAMKQPKGSRSHFRSPNAPDLMPFPFDKVSNPVGHAARMASNPVATLDTLINRAQDDEDMATAVLNTAKTQGLHFLSFLAADALAYWYRNQFQKMTLDQFREQLATHDTEPTRVLYIDASNTRDVLSHVAEADFQKAKASYPIVDRVTAKNVNDLIAQLKKTGNPPYDRIELMMGKSGFSDGGKLNRKALAQLKIAAQSLVKKEGDLVLLGNVRNPAAIGSAFLAEGGRVLSPQWTMVTQPKSWAGSVWSLAAHASGLRIAQSTLHAANPRNIGRRSNPINTISVGCPKSWSQIFRLRATR